MSLGGAIFVSLNGSSGKCIDRLLVRLVKMNHDEGVKESFGVISQRIPKWTLSREMAGAWSRAEALACRHQKSPSS